VGKYIQQSDLCSAQSVQMVVQCCDDAGKDPGDGSSAGVQAIVASLITRSEGMLDAMLQTEDLLPLKVPADRLCLEVCLEFCTAFMFERRPEYARQFGDATLAIASHYKRARELCNDIKSAQLELPDDAPQQSPPNDGGTLANCGPRMTLDGTGDF